MIARAAAVVLGLAALVVQAWSSALLGPAAASPSLPHALAGTWPFAAANRLGLDRIPSVRRELARGALLRGDLATARTALAGAGAGDDADDLRAQLAVAEGDVAAAVRDYGRAADITHAAPLIEAAGLRDPRAGLALARSFDRAASGSPFRPPVAAQIAWREGQLAARTGDVPTALERYRRAAAIDPTQDAYALAVGFESLVAGDAAAARTAYAAVTLRSPQGVDGFAGLALAAAAGGDCRSAVAAETRAAGLAAAQGRTLDPAASGYGATVRAALARCLSGGTSRP